MSVSDGRDDEVASSDTSSSRLDGSNESASTVRDFGGVKCEINDEAGVKKCRKESDFQGKQEEAIQNKDIDGPFRRPDVNLRTVRCSLRRSTSFNTATSSPKVPALPSPSLVIPPLKSATGGLKASADIEHLTEAALENIYEPFSLFKTQLVRQTRDIFVCHYFGNLNKFNEQFLKPASELLLLLKNSSTSPIVSENKEQATGSWPLCSKDHILVHLGEGESRTVLRPGDLYLFISPDCTGSTNKVELKAKYRISEDCGIREIIVNKSDFINVFTMDWPNSSIGDSLAPSDQDLLDELNSLVTAVENGVSRLPWNSIVRSSCPWSVNDESPSVDDTSLKSGCQTIDTSKQLVPTIDSKNAVEDDDGYHDDHESSDQISSLSQLDNDILQNETIILPGCLDVDGRAVVILKNVSNLDCKAITEVSKFFSYYTSTLSKLIIHGFILIVDCREEEQLPSDLIDNILNMIEGTINGIKMVVFKIQSGSLESSQLLEEKLSQPQYSGFSGVAAQTTEDLSKFIPINLVPVSIGGTYTYEHGTWMEFKTKYEEFTITAKKVGGKLVNAMKQIKDGLLPVSHSMTNQVIEDHRKLVTNLLRDDQDLINYRSNSKDLFKELQKMSDDYPQNQDYSHCVLYCSRLRDGIEKVTRKVAKLANKRLHQLENCLQLKNFEEESSQVLSWLRKKGQDSLNKHSSMPDDLPNIKELEREFEKFYFTAMRNIEKGQDLIEEATMLQQSAKDDSIGDVATSLKLHLFDFSNQLEDRREAIEGTAKCYHLLDKSYEWAVNVMKFLSNLKMEQVVCSTDKIEVFLEQLQLYLIKNPPISPVIFDEMNDIAHKVNNARLIEQIKVAIERCNETKDLIKARQTTLLKAKLQIELTNSTQSSDTMSSSSNKSCGSPLPQSLFKPQSNSPRQTDRRSSVAIVSSHNTGPYCTLGSLSHSLNRRVSEYEESVLGDKLITEDLTEQGPVTSISKTLLEARSKEKKQCELDDGESESKLMVLERKLSGGLYGKHNRKLFKRSNTWQVDDPNFYVSLNGDSPERRRSIDSVSSSIQSEDFSTITETNESKIPQDQPQQKSPSPTNNDSQTNIDSPSLEDKQKSKRTLMLIIQEMIQTERDYVNSLDYIIENYIPEMLREDIPQALRGQRNIIFGNIEKIYEFHSCYFLQELEQCEPAPCLVGSCFLRYDPQFHLYALYNKNKPKCDILMTEYGNQFFKRKQIELGDKMDLASYLLKPVQRMGKYALLLKQLLKECPETDPEYQDLRAAEEMVRFQLRHGNDLLAMDALKDCDVNVKEQGRLLRQDEFLVWQGRNRKSFRRVFLFEELILFSKPRRDQENKGHEIYQYKNSIKTTDIGLTENVDASQVKFEIWFRKRKLNEVYVLQAPSPEVRLAWVQEISKQLWKQALRNREMRLVEMSSMGIGNKPCVNIRPSEDQINDRAVNIHFTKGSWMRRTTPHSSFDNFGNKRPHSIISISSSSSSGSSHSSQYGTLNLGFDNGDNSRSLYRSVTQHSQCSNESGICADISHESINCKNRKKAERSDSIMSSDSVVTHTSGLSNTESVGSAKIADLEEIQTEVSNSDWPGIKKTLHATQV